MDSLSVLGRSEVEQFLPQTVRRYSLGHRCSIPSVPMLPWTCRDGELVVTEFYQVRMWINSAKIKDLDIKLCMHLMRTSV